MTQTRAMRILAFADHYLPGYKAGGPVVSLAGLVDNLAGNTGGAAAFSIVTRDRDFGDVSPYAGLIAGRWTRVGKAEVYYLPPANLRMRQVVRLLRETPCDCVYLNSFFSPVMTILPRLAMRLGLVPRRRWVVSPRGEFSPGALAIHPWRKRVFIAVARAIGLYRGVVWLASSDLEAADIRRTMRPPPSRLLVAANFSRAGGSPASRPPRVAGPLRLIFLARIARKKNLGFALSVLAGVKADVDLTICGPAEDAAYWAECQAQLGALPANVRWRYAGAVPSDAVAATLAAHDALLFPTHGENHGHVIIEALQAGLRLIISDLTPWRGLEAAGVGYDLPLADPDAYIAAIESEAARLCEPAHQLPVNRDYLDRVYDLSALKERYLVAFGTPVSSAI